jgi:hypothetical protein
MERNEGIIVLDAGNQEPTLIGPEGLCCFLAYNFYKS